MSHNKNYALQEIEQLDLDHLTYQKKFTDNFTTNFSILVSMIREQTTFSLELINDNASNFFKKVAKSLFSLIKIPADVYYNIYSGNFEGDNILDKYIPILNTIILTACPFLNLIPFVNTILTDIETRIFYAFKSLIFKMFSKSLDYVKSKWQERKNNKQEMELNHVTEIDYYDLNYENIINHPKFNPEKDSSVKAKWDAKQIKNIEDDYLKTQENQAFDFNVFDSSDNFYYDTGFKIDVYKLENEQYLKDNDLPIFSIKPKDLDTQSNYSLFMFI